MIRPPATASHNSTTPPRELLAFVLSHAQVRTNVCSRQKVTQGYTLARRTVPDYNLIHVTAGRVTWVIADEPMPLAAGDLVVVPPGVAHHAYSETKRMALTSLHVEAYLPGGQDVFARLLPPRRQHVAKGSRLAAYLEQAGLDFDRRPRAEALLMMPSWGRLVVLEMLRDNAERGLLAHRPLDPLVAGMMEHLNRTWHQPTTLAALTARAGFTAQHLNRVFRRQIGMTPLQYLARLRMEQAAAMLIDGRLTVQAVAAAAGYDDPYYFSRMFKQHFGRSPTQYREAAGATSASDPPDYSEAIIDGAGGRVEV